jgi:hypothetical protein
MAHRVLRFTLVESSYPLIPQASLHGVTQYRSARPAEAFGQVVHFLPCRRVKAGIHLDTLNLQRAIESFHSFGIF